MKNIIIIIFVCLISLCFAKEIQHVEVIDGDTLSYVTEAGVKKKIRLYGIDAPEKSQPEGLLSTAITKKHIDAASKIDLQVVTVDMYQREVGIVIIKENDCIYSLNERLLLEGAAIYYPNTKPVSNSYKLIEAYAKGKKNGVWNSETFVNPWEWRKK